MATPARFVRVYHSILDDERFREVYDDDHALALWLRLLLLADAIWPMPAHLPHGHRRAALARLVKAGLIELVDGGRYRVHGLDGERARRSEHARLASEARWQNNARTAPSSAASIHTGSAEETAEEHAGTAQTMTPSIARSIARTMPIRREEKRREILIARALGEGVQGEGDELAAVETWLASRRLAVDPASRAGTELARLVDRHGAAAVIAAVERLGPLTDGRQAVYGALKALAPIPDPPPRRRGYEASQEDLDALKP
jgi:hypothetical protein